MAYDAFNSTEIESGKPNKTDLWTKVKGNFDDHESRLTSLEATSLTLAPITFVVKGAHYRAGAQTGIAYVRAAHDLTLTSGKLFIVDAGSSGTLEIDVQKKTGGGAFATIFTTKPSVAYTAGDYSTSSNGVLSVTSITTGDILRLDISQIQTGCDEFHVYLSYEV